MKMIRTMLLAVVTGLFFAVSVLAADIQITINSTDKTMTLTSLLGSSVHVMGLVSPSGYYGTSVELPAQGSVVAPLTGDLPAGIEFARCNAGPNGLSGFTKTLEGFYLIPVQIQ